MAFGSWFRGKRQTARHEAGNFYLRQHTVRFSNSIPRTGTECSYLFFHFQKEETEIPLFYWAARNTAVGRARWGGARGLSLGGRDLH